MQTSSDRETLRSGRSGSGGDGCATEQPIEAACQGKTLWVVAGWAIHFNYAIDRICFRFSQGFTNVTD